MKNMFNIIKRMVFSAFLLYGYNIISVSFNLILPFNFITLGVISCLGSCGLFGLVLFRYLFL